MGVTIRRKARKHLTKARKRLSDYFGHWSTQYPRTTNIGINLLLVPRGGPCLLSLVAVGTLAFHGLFEYVPEFRHLVFDWRTSISKRCISWFINQLTLDYVVCIVGPTALLVLYNLCSTYPEEHMDTLSDIVIELIQKNQVVTERLRALQARAPSCPEVPTTQQDHGVRTNGEDTKAIPDDGSSQVPLESHSETPTSQQDLEVRTDGEDTKVAPSDGNPTVPFGSYHEASTDQQDHAVRTNGEDTKATPGDGAPPEAPIDHGKLERQVNRRITLGLAVIPLRHLRMEGEKGPADALV